MNPEVVPTIYSAGSNYRSREDRQTSFCNHLLLPESSLQMSATSENDPIATWKFYPRLAKIFALLCKLI